jgi:AraC-like DNA-binding protein
MTWRGKFAASLTAELTLTSYSTMVAPHGASVTKDATGSVPVTTILTPDERSAVDAAGAGTYHTTHRSSLEEVRKDLRAQSATAVLVSLACCSPRDAIRMASILREHPRIPVMGLVTSTARVHPQSLLSLGRSGMRVVIDTRESNGWSLLRESVVDAERTKFSIDAALLDLRSRLPSAGEDCLGLFELCFTAKPPLHTVKDIGELLGVHPGTIMSRFQRAGLPSPKRYLDLINLVRASHELEDHRRSLADVAVQLEYSSPQSFGRHIQLVLKMTASAYRAAYDCEGMYYRFIEECITPYVPQLSEFRPFKETAP